MKIMNRIFIGILIGVISAFLLATPAFAATSIRYGWVALDSNKNLVLQGKEYPLSGSVKPIAYITNGVTTVTVSNKAVVYMGNTKVGTAQALIIGDNIIGYEDAFVTTFTIVQPANTQNNQAATSTTTNKNTNTNANAAASKISIASAAVTGVSNKTYNGKAQTQSATVKVSSTTLKSGTDYTVSYKNNTKVGTATMTIKGKGRYTGAIQKDFKISGAPISAAAISGIAKKYYYTGSAIKPAPTIKYNGSTLKLGKDYSLSYSSSLKEGTGTGKVTIAGKGNYSGKKTISFKVENMGDDLARKACELSYSRKKVGGVGTKKYIAAAKNANVYRSPYYGRSCVFCMRAIICAAGYDKGFPSYNWDGSWNKKTSRTYFHYLCQGEKESNTNRSKQSKKWTYVGEYPADKNKLLPGDILLVLHHDNTKNNHIWMYVGNRIPVEVYNSKLKGTDADLGKPTGNTVQGHSSTKSAANIEGANNNYNKSPNPVRIYRCTNPDCK